MTSVELCLLFLAVLGSVGGQLFLKFGADKLAPMLRQPSLATVVDAIQIPELIVGLGCYGFGAVAYVLLLARVPLSMAGPAASLIYVFSVLLGYFVFKETIPPNRIAGLGLIVAGVILVISQK